MALVAYARVSTEDQSTDSQMLALRQAGRDRAVLRQNRARRRRLRQRGGRLFERSRKHELGIAGGPGDTGRDVSGATG